ncbi:MAG: response regulator [Proteobacteria bacterium]|nr:response regulator [Pseudomonadota bacterium]
MQLIKNLSIKHKLIAIIMFISIISLFAASIGFVSANIISSKRAAIAKLSTLANTIGINSKAAIIFKDQKAATETLSAFKTEPDVSYACITDVNGNLFAEYFRENIGGKTSAPEKFLKFDGFLEFDSNWSTYMDASYMFHKKHLCMFSAINFEKEYQGGIYVCANQASLYTQIFWNIIFCTAILCICAVQAYFLSVKLQKSISDPILKLSKTMEKVSAEKDYSVRVETRYSNELGTLYEGFNNMLAQIQERDNALLFTQYAVGHMGDMAFWIDSEGQFIYANNAACTSLGYTINELKLKNVNLVNPKSNKNTWNAHWTDIKDKQAATRETLLSNKTGMIFPIEANFNYVRFKGQEYCCAFARNITDRKRIEAQLQQAQKMEAIGTFVGGVAHDLNNILGGLVGYPELLLLDMPPGNPMAEPLLQIMKSGEKAAAIVQDLLTLARRGVTVEEAVNLNHIVNEYLKTPEHKKMVEYHSDIIYKLDLEQDILNNQGSFFHITKVLMNLMANASESIQNGKGEVLITTQNLHLDQLYKGFQNIPGGDYAILSVSDTGIGISVEDRSKIFEPFYTKKKMGRSGTGLGMTVVRGTVEDHKAYIDITNRKEGGTRFDIYFPVTRDPVKIEAEDFSFESYYGSENVLVVDDVKEQQDIALSLLGYLGYSVEAVSSGEKALEYLQKKTPDIILLDMIMEPGIDGLETCTKILENNPNQKVIICSGFSETERVKQALNRGAYAYIKKPYRIKEIAKTIREALDFKLT